MSLFLSFFFIFINSQLKRYLLCMFYSDDGVVLTEIELRSLFILYVLYVVYSLF